MMALTLTQPWATLIALGVKRIENRTWCSNPMIGQRFAIHASRTVDPYVLREIRAMGYLVDVEIPTSRIVAIATYAAHVENRRDVEDLAGRDQLVWWQGPFAFVLTNIRPVNLDITVNGKQGFWTLDDAIAHEAVVKSVPA